MRSRTYWLLSLLALTLLVVWLQRMPAALSFYKARIYGPVQSGRDVLLGWLPLSIGDIIYILAGWAVVVAVGAGIYHATQYRLQGRILAAWTMGVFNALLAGYLVFVIGWGANYYQPPLRDFWQLTTVAHSSNKAVKRAADSATMVAFDMELIDRLNALAPHFRSLSLDEINRRAKDCYRTYTDSKVSTHGLHIKKSLFGFCMERTAIDGYYNPFTGEGQVNGEITGFIMPFIVCHEMAHQAGIAAEDDANLMAYAVATMPPDPTFNYSAVFNIWIYAHNRVYRRDSTLANKLQAKLNPLTQAHIDTLEQISEQYHHTVAEVSSDVYDSYLRLQNQKDGIRSYGNVVWSAWLLERQRKQEKQTLVRVP